MKGPVADHRPKRTADVPEKPFSEQEFQEELELDFSPEELHEFLAADLVEIPADPGFKQELREKLLALVRERYGRGDPNLPRSRKKT